MHVYGHRGAAGEAPENTLGGFEHAWQRGVRRFELDVQLAADEQLVVLHDTRVNRTTGRSGTVDAFTSRELGAMDARRGAPPWPRREGVPTLEAVMRAFPRTESWQLEVKKPARADRLRITLEALHDLVTRLRLGPRVIVTSSHTAVLDMARQVAPRLARGYVCTKMDPLPTAEEFGCRMVVANLFTCTPALRLGAWRRKIELSAWTVNDPISIRNLYRMRAHSIITDYPSMALPLLGQLSGGSAS